MHASPGSRTNKLARRALGGIGAWLIALAAASTCAAEGRIVFTGAVVNPTCGLASEHAKTTHDLPTQCAQGSTTASYSLHVEPASSYRIPLVAYYESHASARHAGNAVWVATQTYQ